MTGRTHRRAWQWIAILTLGMTTLVPGASGQNSDPKAAREREVLRRLQVERQQLGSQVQSLEAEKSRLAGEAAKTEAERKALQEQLGKREKSEKRLRGELSSRIAKARNELEALEKRFAEVSTQLTDMTAANKTANETLKVRDAQIADLERRQTLQQDVLARQARLLQEANLRNAELAKITRQLLERYQGKGVMDALLHREPFTQIERVRMQNMLQEYEDKIGEQTLAPSTIGKVSP